MRPSVVLVTIVIGGIMAAATFFVFAPLEEESVNVQANVKKIDSEEQQAFLLPISETNYLPIRDFTIPEIQPQSRASALFDVKSNRFLYSNNSNKRLPIASVTKLMTAMVIIDNLSLEEIYTVPAENVNVDGLGADLYRGEKLKGYDLFKIMLIKSSNDAAQTFASYAKSKGIDLVAKMNEKAQDIGMFNTRFSDPAGLNDSESFSTAADLVKLVIEASKYTQISQVLLMPFADVTSFDGAIKHHLINTNQLLGHVEDIIVGKTGYTDRALGTMVLEVSVNNAKDQLISIILGSEDRFGATRNLIDWAKKAYQWK